MEEEVQQEGEKCKGVSTVGRSKYRRERVSTVVKEQEAKESRGEEGKDWEGAGGGGGKEEKKEAE